MSNEAILSCDETEEQIHDLRDLLNEWRVIQLVLIEVQISVEQSRREGFSLTSRSRLMLTLLTYCYAAGFYSSEDIVWACYNEAGARYICANNPADPEAIQQFRRAYRAGIEICLARVLVAAASSHPSDAAKFRPFVTAGKKLEIAIMMDTVTAD